MSIRRFEQIRRFIYFNDNTSAYYKDHKLHDRLHKIRPVIQHLNKQFSKVSVERDISIDEQLCATKAHSFLKQYLPLKSQKWSYKFFVLCGSSRYSYKLLLYEYTKQENCEQSRLQSEPDIMARGNVVVRLSRAIPMHKNH